MSRPLFVAAGGGGDAIAALALSCAVTNDPEPVVMSFAWDRLSVDPLPGPRFAADFTNLVWRTESVPQVIATTRAISPARSLLPRLASETNAQLMLLDPSRGADGLHQQVSDALAAFECTECMLLDVGGDVVARGDEANLLSPLADSLALAAVFDLPVKSTVVVNGIGLDGELTSDEVHHLLEKSNAHAGVTLDADNFAGLNALFEWHPSEATGLLAAAARGLRGAVEIRDRGLMVHLDSRALGSMTLDAADAISTNRIAHALLGSTSLDDVEATVRAVHGSSEIDYERTKASRLARGDEERVVVDVELVDEIAHDANRRGADYLSIRRLAELVGAPVWKVREAVAASRGDKYQPPLYSCR